MYGTPNTQTVFLKINIQGTLLQNKLFCSFCELFKKRSAHAALFILIPETAVPFEECKLKIAQSCKFLHLPYLSAIYIDYNESVYTCICIFLEISKASLVLFTLITMSMCIPATVYSSISPYLSPTHLDYNESVYTCI